MTLTVYEELDQGSDEWLELRRGMLTASVIGQFITPKTVKVAANDKTRATQYQLVAERITGVVEERYVSRDMEAGHFIEPIARDLYSKHYATASECGFMVRDDWGFDIGYSPDGLVGEEGLIEVKMHLPKHHLALILANGIPYEHIAQCQTALLVSQRSWIDYVAFCGGMPLWVKRMLPDPQWSEAIVEAATAFEQTAAQMLRDYEVATVSRPMTKRVVLPWDQEIEIF